MDSKLLTEIKRRKRAKMLAQKCRERKQAKIKELSSAGSVKPSFVTGHGA